MEAVAIFCGGGDAVGQMSQLRPREKRSWVIEIGMRLTNSPRLSNRREERGGGLCAAGSLALFSKWRERPGVGSKGL